MDAVGACRCRQGGLGGCPSLLRRTIRPRALSEYLDHVWATLRFVEAGRQGPCLRQGPERAQRAPCDGGWCLGTHGVRPGSRNRGRLLVACACTPQDGRPPARLSSRLATPNPLLWNRYLRGVHDPEGPCPIMSTAVLGVGREAAAGIRRGILSRYTALTLQTYPRKDCPVVPSSSKLGLAGRPAGQA